MTLFRRDDFPMSFDFVGLDDDVLNELTQLVERHGGKIVSDENLPIKFTRSAKFVSEAFPKFKLYDIEFIRECVKQSKIVDPSTYRIGKPMLYDDCVMSHYLKGPYDCCNRKQYIKTPDIKLELQVSCLKIPMNYQSKQSPLQGHAMRSIAGSGQNVRLKRKCSERITLLSSENTGSDTSDDELVISPAPKRRGRGVEYSLAEETQMLTYIIERDAVFEAGTGLTVWRDMINDGYLATRTQASLYLHFKKSILPKIEQYGLLPKHMKMFEELRQTIE